MAERRFSVLACLIAYSRGEERVRAVIEHHHVLGLSAREAAARAGVSRAFARKHINGFHAAMRQAGEEEMADGK